MKWAFTTSKDANYVRPFHDKQYDMQLGTVGQCRMPLCFVVLTFVLWDSAKFSRTGFEISGKSFIKKFAIKQKKILSVPI